MSTDKDAASDRILEEAIAWMLSIREGMTDPAERHAFEKWLANDQRHQQTWDKLAQRLSLVQSLEGKVSGTGLVGALASNAIHRRAAMAKIGGSAAMGIAGLALLGQTDLLYGITADYKTATAERRDFSLPDGTTLSLDARSRADRIFAPGVRGVALHEGNAIVKIADRDTPFRTQLGALSVMSSGGTLVLSHGRGATRAIVRTGAASFALADNDHAAGVAPDGYEVRDELLVRLPRKDIADADCWTRGLAILHDRTIGDLIEAMRPYQAGILAASRQAAKIPLSGVFDITDLDGTLSLIGSLHPLKFVRIGAMLQYIDIA